MVLEETGLRADMIRFSINILLLSLVISVVTAGMVYLSLRALLVRSDSGASGQYGPLHLQSRGHPVCHPALSAAR